MSLLSNSPAILLLPGRALLRRGGQAQEAARGEGWDGALAALETLLPTLARGQGVRIGLSHHFAGLHLLPAPPVRLAAEEMRGWLSERLAEDFGVEAEGWRLAWEDVPPGRPVPVTSLPAERYDALRDRLLASGHAVKQLSPWLASAWRQHHRAIGRGRAWLALLEAGRLVLLRVAKGRPTSVVMSRLGDASVDSQASLLAAAIARQALHLGVAAEGDVWLLAPDQRVDAFPPGSSLRLRPLLPAGSGWGGLLP